MASNLGSLQVQLSRRVGPMLGNRFSSRLARRSGCEGRGDLARIVEQHKSVTRMATMRPMGDTIRPQTQVRTMTVLTNRKMERREKNNGCCDLNRNTGVKMIDGEFGQFSSRGFSGSSKKFRGTKPVKAEDAESAGWLKGKMSDATSWLNKTRDTKESENLEQFEAAFIEEMWNAEEWDFQKYVDYMSKSEEEHAGVGGWRRLLPGYDQQSGKETRELGKEMIKQMTEEEISGKKRIEDDDLVRIASAIGADQAKVKDFIDNFEGVRMTQTYLHEEKALGREMPKSNYEIRVNRVLYPSSTPPPPPRWQVTQMLKKNGWRLHRSRKQ